MFQQVPESSVFHPERKLIETGSPVLALFWLFCKSFFIRVNTYNSIKLEMSMPN